MSDNPTLERLKNIASSDDYDMQSGKIVERLQEQWDMAVAADNLGEHIIVKDFVKEIKADIEGLDAVLQIQVVKNTDDIYIRYKLQADKASLQKVLNIFDGSRRKQVQKLIDDADARATQQGD